MPGESSEGLSHQLGCVIYFVLWIYGLFAVGNDQINFVPVNDADNWLHLGLALGMVLLGVFAKREPRRARSSAGLSAGDR